MKFEQIKISHFIATGVFALALGAAISPASAQGSPSPGAGLVIREQQGALTIPAEARPQ
jgi:hypothetical protein